MAYVQVRAACAAGSSSVNVNAPVSAVFDGVTINIADPAPKRRVLLTNQSTTSQNGVWRFNGTGNAMTRPATPDQYAAGSALDNATIVWVTEGDTRAGTVWGVDPATLVTVDTTAHKLTRVSLPPVQCRAATTADISIGGTHTSIDGVTLVGDGTAGSDIVLVKDQAAPEENGLYWANTGGALTGKRCTEPLTPGRAAIVSEGDRNAHRRYELVTKTPIVLDVTELAFSPQNASINVRDFGATGEGAIDDAQFVRDALASMGPVDTTDLPGKRARLFFPNGKYRFASAVRVDRRCDIEGETAGGVTIVCDDYASAFIFHAQYNSPTGGASDQSRIWNIDFIGGPTPATIDKWQPNTAYVVTQKVVPGNAACPNPNGSWWDGLPEPKDYYTDSPYSWEYYYECLNADGAGESADVSGISNGEYLALDFPEAHPWLENHVEEDGLSVIKLPPPTLETQLDTDRVFFACTDLLAGPGSVTSSASSMPDFYTQAVGVEFTDNEVKWTPFRTNEPDWRTTQCPDDSVPWAAAMSVVYGTVVRAAGRWDAVFFALLPAVGQPAETTGGMEPAGLATAVFGDQIVEGDITWECWPTGAEEEPPTWVQTNYNVGDKVLSPAPAKRRYVCVTGGFAGAADPFPGADDPDPLWDEPLIADGACEWRAYAPIGSMILDNDLVWGCKVANAIRLMAPSVEIASCSMTNFPNAGVHIQADSASVNERGFGIVPAANANEWTIRKLLIQQCGAGIVTRAGDANAGRAYDVSVTGTTGEGGIVPEERGIADRGFGGNRWFGPFVQNIGGPGFWTTSGGNSGSLAGGYFELTGYLDIPSLALTLLGGTIGAGIQVFGQPRNVRGVTSRTTCVMLASTPTFCQGLVEPSSIIEASPAQFQLGDFRMEPDSETDGYYAWVWNATPGWWTHQYNSDVFGTPVALSSASTDEGYGLVAFPRGFYLGGGYEDRRYVFASVASSGQARVNGAARNVGDRRFRADRAVPGGSVEQVVTTAGKDGVTWDAGVQYTSGNPSGKTKFAGDTVIPSDETIRSVYQCIGGDAVSIGPEPDWELEAPNLNDTFVNAADGIEWKNIGTQPVWTDCNRVHGGQVEYDLTPGNQTLTENEAAFDIIKASTAGANRTLTFPTPADDARTYQRVVRNALGAAADLTVTTSGGTSVTIADTMAAIIGFEPAGAFRVTADA